MDADLSPIYERVMRAVRPEDLFIELTVLLPPRLLAKHLAQEVEQMRTVLTEESYSSTDDREAARMARARFEDLYGTALAKAGSGHYGLDDYSIMPLQSGTRIVVGGSTYAVGEKIHEGIHADVYGGRMSIDQGSAGVVMRLAHTPDDNPVLYNEIRVIERLHREEFGYWRNVPFMFGRFSAGERVGIIYRYFEGLTLTDLRADPLHKSGLDQRHVVWVLDRVLGLLGYIHSKGVVHGHIAPDKVRVRPSNHNALLTGWGTAVVKPAQTGERIFPVGSVFEAPEVQDGGSVGPWTDIYSLGKTLIWLIGGDPVTNSMPDAVEPKLRMFLLNMVRRSPKGRPQDAWQLYEAQNRLKDSLWERRFVHLNISTGS